MIGGKRLALGFGLVALLSAGAARSAPDIVSSKHNLSVSGPGTVKAQTETQVCVFCHTPHNASPVAPLWNRSGSSASYVPYTSSTQDAAPGQPTGATKLCLGCHDGTIALGDVLSEPSAIAMAGGITTMPAGDSNLGTSLADDHPVSFPFTPGLASADGELVNPATLTGEVHLDPAGELQCTSCHDPHDDSNGKFLVVENAASALCLECHGPTGWAGASHRTSTATWNGSLPDPWFHTDGVTVASNACESCHDPHAAAGAERLRNYADEERNCLPCHNGNVAATDLEAEFAKPHRHPIAAQVGVHDPEENPLAAPRHVECEDCHDPHAANGTSAIAPAIGGPQHGVPGIDGDGAPVAEATMAYQVCYRCHAGSAGQPAPSTPRQVAESNVRLQFDPANASFHPIETAGVNPNVPSLFGPWTTGSVLYCHDCHSNDAGGSAGGPGPEGPHGSIYPSILGWRFETGQWAENAQVYALCYRCHLRSSILGDDSFGEHRLHVVSERASCNMCHDPHGVRPDGGTTGDHTHLINFDLSVVQPNSNGVLEFRDTGVFHGTCSLRCHGENHSNEGY